MKTDKEIIGVIPEYSSRCFEPKHYHKAELELALSLLRKEILEMIDKIDFYKIVGDGKMFGLSRDEINGLVIIQFQQQLEGEEK